MAGLRDISEDDWASLLCLPSDDDISSAEGRQIQIAHQLITNSLHAVAERLIVDLVHPGVDDREREGFLRLVSEASVRAEFVGSASPIRVILKSAGKFGRFVLRYCEVVACEAEQHIGHGDYSTAPE